SSVFSRNGRFTGLPFRHSLTWTQLDAAIWPARGESGQSGGESVNHHQSQYVSSQPISDHCEYSRVRIGKSLFDIGPSP
ncbi:MAG TPA: hypothetical protein VLJ12_07980, partial [Burkholderiales bacterium]|nr:hypothetical protein [Burkholderiales bacterium]